MTAEKPTKYDHSHFTWHTQDLFSDCTKTVVKCRFGHEGHRTSHLNQNVRRVINDDLKLQVIKYIAHSHFTHETDRGRHVLCEVGRAWISAKLCHTEYTLHRKTLPNWLRRELYGE